MNLNKLIATKSDCYKAGRKIQPKGIMVHSTGANNPRLSRYVGPDDGKLGNNKNNNHWNMPGVRACVHAWIGKLADGTVATYQTLPWNHRGWHAAGSANDTHISFEICEDGLEDKTYFDKVYKEAVELCVYLCNMYDWDESVILDHSEGYRKGIASNHGDVMHWFPKHGKSMDTFREDVKKGLSGLVYEKPSASHLGKSISTLASEVIAGKYGTGEARKKALGPAYPEVQNLVNQMLNGNVTEKLTKSIDELAREVIAGKHGSGEARKKSLGNLYSEVQTRVNEMLKSNGSSVKTKTVEQLADEVIRGLHGSGRERMISLGNMYAPVQQEVNKRIRMHK